MDQFNEIDFNGILGDDINLDELNKLLEDDPVTEKPSEEADNISNIIPPAVNEEVTVRDIHEMMPQEVPEIEEEPVKYGIDRGAAAILEEAPDVQEKIHSQSEFQEKIKIMSQINTLRSLLKKEKIDVSGIEKHSIKSDLIELNAELALLEYKYFYTMTGGINIVEQSIVGGAKCLEKKFNGERALPLTDFKPNLKNWSNSVAILMRKRRYTTFKASNSFLDLLGAKHGSFLSVMAELSVNAVNQIGTNSLNDKFNMRDSINNHED
jgi:hypothetical protein